MGIKNIRGFGGSHIMQGEKIYFIVFILSIMLYFGFHPEYYWLYRYPIAFLVGNDVGISIWAAIHSDFILQVAETAAPLTAATGMDTLDNVLIFIGCITALSHFIFNFE